MNAGSFKKSVVFDFATSIKSGHQPWNKKIYKKAKKLSTPAHSPIKSINLHL